MKISRLMTTGLSLLVICLAVSGCASYRLGSMLPRDIKTIHINQFDNQTTEPFVQVEATRATIREFQRDGSLRVVDDPEDADVILSANIYSYQLSPVGFEEERQTTANEYRQTLFASMILTHRESGKVLVENPRVQGESTFIVAGDLTTSKRRLIPEAATDLGRNIVDSVVEAWQE